MIITVVLYINACGSIMLIACSAAGINYKAAGKRRKKHKRCEYKYPHIEFFGREVNLSFFFLYLSHHFTFPIKSNKNIKLHYRQV
jgi:hypothetical protein